MVQQIFGMKGNGMKTERKQLASNRCYRKQVDMEWVYKELDGGRTIKCVAEELGISVSTLRRRHNEYQRFIKEENRYEKAEGEIGIQSVYEYGDNSKTFEF